MARGKNDRCALNHIKLNPDNAHILILYVNMTSYVETKSNIRIFLESSRWNYTLNGSLCDSPRIVWLSVRFLKHLKWNVPQSQACDKMSLFHYFNFAQIAIVCNQLTSLKFNFHHFNSIMILEIETFRIIGTMARFIVKELAMG